MSDAPKRRWPLLVGCGSLLFLSCCGCMVWAFFEGQANRSEYGDLEAACRGLPSSGTGPFPVPAPRAIGMSHGSDGRWTMDGSSAPDDIRPSSRSDTNVVVCTEPEVVIEDPTCSFTDVVFRTHTFRRNHRVVHARIVAASTGATLFEGNVASSPPPCDLTATGLVPDDGYVYEGDSIDRGAISTWYQTWVATLPR